MHYKIRPTVFCCLSGMALVEALVAICLFATSALAVTLALQGALRSQSDFDSRKAELESFRQAAKLLPGLVSQAAEAMDVDISLDKFDSDLSASCQVSRKEAAHSAYSYYSCEVNALKDNPQASSKVYEATNVWAR
ncbi:MAG: hypothetical protein IT291_00195 [Deltaproteobacteria bacterium]|nr:hypothetical protein [Deltaproteobacteria bacterium]